MQSLRLQSNPSPETEVSAQPNREIAPASTQRQCEDIPGMLLFDSNLLRVDGLIDADDLGGKKRRANERKAQQNSGKKLIVNTKFRSMFDSTCAKKEKKNMLARSNMLLLQTPTDMGDI